MQCPYCQAEISSLQAQAAEDYPVRERVSAQLAGKRLSTDTEACASCGQTMHIRRHPVSKEVYLLSKEDACSLDSMRLANLYLKLTTDPFAQYLSRSAEDNRAAGGADPASGSRTIARTIWDVLDRRRRTAVKNKNWDIASKLALEKARYRCSIGKPFFSLLQDAKRYQLLSLQAQGATHVRIIAVQDALACPRCAEQSGAVLTIEEALAKMPLPVRCDCVGRQATIAADPGWCRCVYVRQSR